MTSAPFWSMANPSPTLAGLATLASVFAVIVTAIVGVRRSDPARLTQRENELGPILRA